ncbi:uncharacterized protein [Antedon mediterranea]|uniref:uncharacterized protein n=1 Tax=Antedon mediterranea TaxID=105859 RepID=UPI003AF478EF
MHKYVFMTGELEVKPGYLKFDFLTYKYCLVRKSKNGKKEFSFEFLYNQNGKKIVNRALMTKSMNLKTGEIWHQYDNMIHHRKLKDLMNNASGGQKSLFGRAIEHVTVFFFGDSTMSNFDKRIAADYKEGLLSYLPAWEGFVCANADTSLKPCEAIKKFIDIATSMKGTHTNLQDSPEIKVWVPYGYSSNQVICQHLEPKINQLGSISTSDNDAIIKVLTSALAIVHILIKSSIYLKQPQVNNLLHALLIPPNLSTKEYDFIIEKVKEEFAPIMQ